MPATTTRDVRMNVAGYQVTDVLGDGASGIVFAATSPAGRPVALKVLKPELISPRERQRFLEEADRLRRVRHPALVELVDAGPLPDGGAYIAMARLDGQNLLERLQRGPMRFDRALALFEQIAGALGAMHHAGLVHRDIKPENIFVEQGDLRAVLLDLGIARDVSADPSTTTRAGMIRGTPAYMAPERFFGKPATPQTDLYELAVVLYVALVGALPWSSADNPTERLRPVAPSARGVVLPARLQSTLMSALSAQPEERPRSAEDFMTAVIDALSPESIQLIVAQRTGRSVMAPGQADAGLSHAPASGSPAFGAPASTLTGSPLSQPYAQPAVTYGPGANRPRSGAVTLGIIIGGIAAVLLAAGGAIGAFVYLQSKEAAPAPSTTAAPSPPASVATRAPEASASASATPAPAPSRSPTTAKPEGKKVVPAATTGKCRCYPNAGTNLHGGNTSLARTSAVVPKCECSGSQGDVCFGPLNPCRDMRGGTCRDLFSDRCSQRFVREKNLAGTSCRGINSVGVDATGKFDCRFDLADLRVFPGPEGAKCTGFRVSGDETDGFIRCD